ncbi:ADP-ribosylation factor GTPase-activating protein [Musa troglodytarum]|uniref:Signal recognition particle receptor subunit beta n=1 Tax=Musa troglodytarum TaxID=320322 RepID=A0A9E7HBP7_9LILI|nr:ADP-ribosylation factor GTPase-activating protein [Musa troglodytarum]
MYRHLLFALKPAICGLSPSPDIPAAPPSALFLLHTLCAPKPAVLPLSARSLSSTVRIFRRSKSNTIVLAGLNGSGKTVLFYQLRDGSPHLGTVTSMEPNDGTFVLHSELEKKGKLNPVHLIDVPGHSRLRPKLDEFLPHAAGVIFVVDSLDFLPNCRAAAESLFMNYYVDYLLYTVVCKADKVTAHSKEFIRKQLEKEIDKLRTSRSAISTADITSDYTLGVPGEAFSFSHCRNKVTVADTSGLTGEISQVEQFIRELIKRVWPAMSSPRSRSRDVYFSQFATCFPRLRKRLNLLVLTFFSVGGPEKKVLSDNVSDLGCFFAVANMFLRMTIKVASVEHQNHSLLGPRTAAHGYDCGHGKWKKLRDLMIRSDNRICADCCTPDPKWAEVHRSLGAEISKVLSLTLDEWSETDMDSMIQVGGNSYANSIYEAFLPKDYPKPKPDSSNEERTKFIRSKYVSQDFLTPSLRIVSSKLSFQTLESGKELGCSVTSNSSKKNKAQTTVKKSNLNPVWNEELKFSIPQRYGALKLQVYDHDVLSADDIMGEAEIDLQPMITATMAFGDSELLANMQIGKWLKTSDNALVKDSIVNIVDGKIKQETFGSLSQSK